MCVYLEKQRVFHLNRLQHKWLYWYMCYLLLDVQSALVCAHTHTLIVRKKILNIDECECELYFI